MTGRCLCGAVAFEVRGPVRDVVLCHCEECRRRTGNAGAFAAARAADLVLAGKGGLRWHALPEDGLPRDEPAVTAVGRERR